MGQIYHDLTGCKVLFRELRVQFSKNGKEDMNKTTELLKKALEIKKAAEWCRQMNISEAALSLARKRGRLSPTLAGQFALALGEDPIRWTAIAAIEAEPESPLLDAIRSRVCILCKIGCVQAKRLKPAKMLAFCYG